MELTGLRLHSAFQSIFSVAHAKVVGHEALLRGQDARDVSLSPADIFPLLSEPYSADQVQEHCARLHLNSFAEQKREGWLFLNVSPDAVPSRADVTRRFGKWLAEVDLPAHRVVVEIVETRSYDERRLADAVEGFRDLGCLVAIDDFGAGESNFERVWRLRPDLVKLDRAMLEEATVNPLVRHILPGIVSLVHEAGCLVVLEGIETLEQALLAMESDVDFVQGYHFSRPSVQTPEPDQAQSTFAELRRALRMAVDRRTSQDRGFFQSYTGGFEACVLALEDGEALRDSCGVFLALAGVQRVYLLDAHGKQIEENVEARDERAIDARFEPCASGVGADWFRRPYFQRAIQAPGVTQVSRPYLSIRDAKNCVTLSLSYEGPDGAMYVLCADLDYDPSEPLSHRYPRNSQVRRRPDSF